MQRTRFAAVAAFTALSAAAAPAALAEGYLAAKSEALPVLEIGLGDAGYGVSQKDFNLTTGKGYKLTLKSTGRKECAWQAAEFFSTVWLRKVEIEKVEVKAMALTEIEMEDEGEAEIHFVPVKPGEYTWRCKGLEERGVIGKFIVK